MVAQWAGVIGIANRVVVVVRVLERVLAAVQSWSVVAFEVQPRSPVAQASRIVVDGVVVVVHVLDAASWQPVRVVVGGRVRGPAEVTGGAGVVMSSTASLSSSKSSMVLAAVGVVVGGRVGYPPEVAGRAEI